MKRILLIFTVAGLVLTGCKKGFLDLNENPNFPSEVPAKSLLPAALVKTANLIVDPNLDFPQVWMQYWAFSSNYAVNIDSRSYQFTNAFRQGFFTNVYSTAFDYEQIINFGNKQGNKALEGIGRVMKSFVMQMAVDVYNNVPYSEALKGAALIAPKYDDAKTIYESLYSECNAGIALMQAAQPEDFPDDKSDIMFGATGDAQNLWIKLANTLKLKLLLRQSERADRASYISAKIAADFPDGLDGFLQAGEGGVINPGYTNSDNKQNPFWASFGFEVGGQKTGNNDFYKTANYAIQQYAVVGGRSDARILFVSKPSSATLGAGSINYAGIGYWYRGNEMGVQGAGTYSDNCSNATFDPYRFVEDRTSIMTDFESLFLQSEAVQRGWFTGDAGDLFRQAVEQSYTYDLQPNADFFGGYDGIDFLYSFGLVPSAYWPANEWASTSSADKIKLIMTQKWFAMNGVNFLEPWTDYRRTGFPAVPLSTHPSAAGRRIPLRYKYPQREYDLNGANVSTQGNIDQFTSKIWWMP